LVDSDPLAKDLFGDKYQKVNKSWDDLKIASANRKEKLEGLYLFIDLFSLILFLISKPIFFKIIIAINQALQYYALADEAEQFIKEKEPLVISEDVGQDEETVQILLKKHQALEDDLNSYEYNINSLRNQAKVIFF